MTKEEFKLRVGMIGGCITQSLADTYILVEVMHLNYRRIWPAHDAEWAFIWNEISMRCEQKQIKGNQYD